MLTSGTSSSSESLLFDLTAFLGVDAAFFVSAAGLRLACRQHQQLQAEHLMSYQRLVVRILGLRFGL